MAHMCPHFTSIPTVPTCIFLGNKIHIKAIAAWSLTAIHTSASLPILYSILICELAIRVDPPAHQNMKTERASAKRRLA